MPQRPKRVRFKDHWNYSVEEIARTAGVHKNTVRTWQQAGLASLDKRRPTLFLGGELNRFHEDRRRKRRSPCGPETIYCLPCRAPQRPAEDMVDYIPSTPTLGNLRGICPACGRLIHRRVALASLRAIAGELAVAFPEGDGSIRESTQPSVNCDSNRTKTT